MVRFYFKRNTYAWLFKGLEMKVLRYQLQVRMDEAEVLYFHGKLQDAAINEVPTQNIMKMFSCLYRPTK